VTLTDIAKRENVSPRTVSRWIDDGHLRATRVPLGRLQRMNRTRIAPEGYDAFRRIRSASPSKVVGASRR
jgi:excisionase family DNA binding protein